MGLNAIGDIIHGVKSFSLLANISVHAPVIHMLKMVYTGIKNGVFYFDAKGSIVKFIWILTLKMLNEPFLVELLFNGAKGAKKDKGDYVPL